MSATLKFPAAIITDRIRYVKNLGWLLRHWQDVSHFTLRTHIEGKKLDGTLLVAWLKGGGYYSAGWAGGRDHSLMLRWPVFKGLMVCVDPPDTVNASNIEDCKDCEIIPL